MPIQILILFSLFILSILHNCIHVHAYKQANVLAYGNTPYLRLMNFERSIIPESDSKMDFSRAFVNDLGMRLEYDFACALEQFSLAVAKTGELVFFGKLKGRFGDRSLESFPGIISFLDIENNGPVKKLACGARHAFIHFENGQFLVFGRGMEGQLGLGKDPQLLVTPVMHYKVQNVSQVYANGDHSMILDHEGRVFHWGTWKEHESMSSRFDGTHFNNFESVHDFTNDNDRVSFFPLQLPVGKRAKSASPTPLGGFVVGLENSCLYGFGSLFSNTFQEPSVTQLNYPCVFDRVWASNEVMLALAQNGTLYYSQSNGQLQVVDSLHFPSQSRIETITISHDGLCIFFFDNKEMRVSSFSGNQLVFDHPKVDATPSPFIVEKELSAAQSPFRSLDCSSAHCMGIDDQYHLVSFGESESRQSCVTLGLPAEYEQKWISCEVDHLSEFNITVASLQTIGFSSTCNIVLHFYDGEQWSFFQSQCDDASHFTVLPDLETVFPSRSTVISFLTGVPKTTDNFVIFGADLFQFPIAISTVCMEDKVDCRPENPETDLLTKFTSFHNAFAGKLDEGATVRGRIFVLHVAESPSKGVVEGVWLVRHDSIVDYYKPFLKLPGATYFYVTHGRDTTMKTVLIPQHHKIIIYEPYDHIEEYKRVNLPEVKIIKITSGINWVNSTVTLSDEGRVYRVHYDTRENVRTYSLLELTVTNASPQFMIHIAALSTGELYALDEVGQLYIIESQHLKPLIRSSTESGGQITSMQASRLLEYEGVVMTQNIFCFNYSSVDARACSGKGLCTFSDTCKCVDQLVGKECQYSHTCFGRAPDDSKVCSGHGECIGQNQCECHAGYVGKHCEYDFTCFGRSPDTDPCGEGTCRKQRGSSEGKCVCDSDAVMFFGLGCISQNLMLFMILLFISLGVILVVSSGLAIIFPLCCIVALNKRFSDKKHRSIIEKKEHLLLSYERDQVLDVLDPDKANFELKKELFEIDQQEIAIEKKLGSGAQGVVFKATWAGKQCAVKYFNCKLLTGERMFDEFNREASLLSSLRHMNIISFYGATLSWPRIGLVMEYASSGSVDQLILSGRSKQLSKKETFKMLIDVCDAMHFLHSRNIIHRDLKWQNVLMEGGVAKITDFGMSKMIVGGEGQSEENNHTRNVGTSLYVAPENFRGSNYSSSVDMYAFGIMIFELLCGVMNPWSLDAKYKSMPLMTLTSRAANDASFRPDTKHLREKGFAVAIPICVSAWHHDPSRRPSFKEVREFFISLKDILGDE